MSILGMRSREDYWFVGGLMLALMFGIIVGSTLNIFFLIACSFVLAVVEVFTWLFVALDKPGPFAVWLVIAIPVLLIATWMAVIVSVWGFLR